MDWTLDLIERSTTRLLGKQGPFRPTVRLVEAEGGLHVAKDYRACTPLYRWTVGKWNLRRETKALTRLAGLDGIPALEARVGRWVIVISHVRGRDVGKTDKARQTPEFFDGLLDLVREMHGRGVVHLDLRQRRNLICRPDGRPAIIDFGSSLCLRPSGRLLRRLARIDVSGVLKYKQRARPGSLSPDEARLLQSVDKRRRLWPFS